MASPTTGRGKAVPDERGTAAAERTREGGKPAPARRQPARPGDCEEIGPAGGYGGAGCEPEEPRR